MVQFEPPYEIILYKYKRPIYRFSVQTKEELELAKTELEKDNITYVITSDQKADYNSIRTGSAEQIIDGTTNSNLK